MTEQKRARANAILDLVGPLDVGRHKRILNSKIRYFHLYGALDQPALWPYNQLEQLIVKNCSVGRGMVIEGAHLRDCAFENVEVAKNSSPILLANCVFERCIISGSLGQVQCGLIGADLTEVLYRQTQQFYDSIDWALDVRSCCSDLLILATLPAEKIRRDSQFSSVVPRTALDGFLEESRENMELVPFRVAVALAKRLPGENVVLVARDRERQSRALMHYIGQKFGA